MLNAAQIARRTGKLTASRVACLMNGDAVAIDRLYREFIGEELPEDLSHVWPVRLGEVTEQLQLDWYEEKHKQRVSRRGDFVNHPFLPWAGATLDGWIDDLQCPIECKHTGGREPLEIIVSRYQPQIQWQCEVTGADQAALSIIFGASEPTVEFIERDAAYAAEMITRGEMFMRCVETRTPPVALPEVPAPVDAKAIYPMEGNNLWASKASLWLETRDATQDNADAVKVLKSLVPPDAHKCFGHGVRITRDKAGRLSLREEETKQA